MDEVSVSTQSMEEYGEWETWDFLWDEDETIWEVSFSEVTAPSVP